MRICRQTSIFIHLPLNYSLILNSLPNLLYFIHPHKYAFININGTFPLLPFPDPEILPLTPFSQYSSFSYVLLLFQLQYLSFSLLAFLIPPQLFPPPPKLYISSAQFFTVVKRIFRSWNRPFYVHGTLGIQFPVKLNTIPNQSQIYITTYEICQQQKATGPIKVAGF